MIHIAVVAHRYEYGKEHIKSIEDYTNLKRINNSSTTVETYDGKFYHVVCQPTDIEGFLYDEVIVVPGYETFVDKVKKRVRK